MAHIAHPFDYTDFTANDLIDLVYSLFNGKIKDIKEKLDGFNIEATMNNEGQVVFIRNKIELNSEKGGITINEMYEKWKGKDKQIKVYTTAGKIIEQIFKKFDPKFFNPDSIHRKIYNCECIISGQTNIMPYASDKVAFHGYKIYKYDRYKWLIETDVEGNVDDIYKAAEGIDEAKSRPNLVIKQSEETIKLSEQFINEIAQLWKNENLDLNISIEDWKRIRFKKFAPEWCKDDLDIFNRICNDDKSVNANVLKKRYPEHKEDIYKLDKELKNDIIYKIMEPIDILFLSIGNELINQLHGFINSGSENEIINKLKTDLNNIINKTEESNSIELKKLLDRSLQRLQYLKNKLNVAEGIVIMYKGRRIKMTGSFAPLNQAIGIRFDLEKI